MIVCTFMWLAAQEVLFTPALPQMCESCTARWPFCSCDVTRWWEFFSSIVILWGHHHTTVIEIHSECLECKKFITEKDTLPLICLEILLVTSNALILSLLPLSDTVLESFFVNVFRRCDDSWWKLLPGAIPWEGKLLKPYVVSPPLHSLGLATLDFRLLPKVKMTMEDKCFELV